MIPKGTIFSKMRAAALDLYPQGSVRYAHSPLTLANWLDKGFFTPIEITKTTLKFVGSKVDVGAALYTDLEFTINQCYEQIDELLFFASDDRIRSDAWNVVTIYYFSFFCAQALLRLTGSPIISVNDRVVESIRKQTSVILQKGTYSFGKTDDNYANNSSYELKSLGHRRSHEAVWLQLMNYFQNEVNAEKTSSSNAEIYFYDLLTCKELYKIYNSHVWPSEVRNAANYRPGFAYKLIEDRIIGKTKLLSPRWSDLSEQKCTKILADSLKVCGNNPDAYHLQVRVLYDLSNLLVLLMRTLYIELLNRHGSDRRWELKRQSFLKKTGLNSIPLLSA